MRRNFEAALEEGTLQFKKAASVLAPFLMEVCHFKLTFQSKLQSAQNKIFAKVTKRRKDLENLRLYIDFDPKESHMILRQIKSSEHYETMCLLRRLRSFRAGRE